MSRKKCFLRGETAEILLVIAAIGLTNLLFFCRAGWNMNPVYIAVVSLVAYLGMRRIWQERRALWKRRRMMGIVVFGVLFSLMVVAGDKIQAGSWEFSAFSVSDIAGFILYFLIGSILFANLYLLSNSRKMKTYILEKPETTHGWNKREWLVYSGILAFAWLPVFFIYYPGIVPDDATVSIAMVVGEMPWDNHYPVFYSLIIGGFLFIGYLFNSLNLGVALYSIFQLVTMALILGALLVWLKDKGLKKLFVYLFLFYFAAAPVFGNYAIVMWKDPWFSGVLLLLSMFLYDHVIVDRGSFLRKKNLLCYAALLILMALLRNNGVYIGILISVCLLVLYRKRLKRVFLTSLISIFLIFFITGPVYQWVFSAENLFVESIGIPLQQMARVVVTGGELSEKEAAFLNELLPLELYDDYYNPFLVDPIKWAPEFDTEYLDAHKKEFFSVWCSMLPEHFKTYVEQYLMGTYGFWHIGGDLKYEFVKSDIAGNSWGLYQVQPFENYVGYQMQEILNGKYDYVATGLLIWMMLYDVILCWVKRKSAYILPLLVFVGNWLTLMVATPAAFGIRYVYVCVIGLPLLLAYGFMVWEED